MRNKTTIAAAAVVAALALTLTGCGDDGDSDGSSLFGKPDKGGSQAIGGNTGGATGGDEIKIPGPNSTGLIGGSNSTGTSGSTGGGSGDASKAQGIWYTTKRTSSGQVGILSVSGSAFAMRMGTMTCSGTATEDMSVNANCQGDSMTGKAALSDGDQKLTITWDNGGSEEFSRQMPTS
ncbi:hypothetical protein ACMA1D_01150 [Streptomyces sp. 796.1]|uniref:hypothetical protein n=1 Tax=Streptomyces sp. 796.1 TaxID=3163029 RepID=UPI0039C90460